MGQVSSRCLAIKAMAITPLFQEVNHLQPERIRPSTLQVRTQVRDTVEQGSECLTWRLLQGINIRMLRNQDIEIRLKESLIY